jgi:hypothetical protein
MFWAYRVSQGDSQQCSRSCCQGCSLRCSCAALPPCLSCAWGPGPGVERKRGHTTAAVRCYIASEAALLHDTWLCGLR